METTFNNFETETDSITFEDQQSDFATQTFSFPGGEGEDGEDGDEEESNGDNKNQSKESDGDNPPLDEEVVHSPLQTQDGGKPGK